MEHSADIREKLVGLDLFVQTPKRSVCVVKSRTRLRRWCVFGPSYPRSVCLMYDIQRYVNYTEILVLLSVCRRTKYCGCSGPHIYSKMFWVVRVGSDGAARGRAFGQVLGVGWS